MTKPPQTAQAILASWVANAKPWTDAVRGGHIESRRAGTDVAIVNAVRALNVSRVLDVGCGEGWLCRALDDAGMKVTGIDGSSELIQAAREPGGGTFHTCTYDELIASPLVFGDFEAAVCNFSLFELNLQPMLTALRELLTSGGTLVIQTVHPGCAGATADGWRQENFGPPDKGLFSPMPWYFRTSATWEANLFGAGFTNVVQSHTKHPLTSDPLSLILHAREFLRGERNTVADEAVFKRSGQ